MLQKWSEWWSLIVHLICHFWYAYTILACRKKSLGTGQATKRQKGWIFGKLPKEGGGVIFHPKSYVAHFGPLYRGFSDVFRRKFANTEIYQIWMSLLYGNIECFVEGNYVRPPSSGEGRKLFNASLEWRKVENKEVWKFDFRHGAKIPCRLVQK